MSASISHQQATTPWASLGFLHLYPVSHQHELKEWTAENPTILIVRYLDKKLKGSICQSFFFKGLCYKIRLMRKETGSGCAPLKRPIKNTNQDSSRQVASTAQTGPGLGYHINYLTSWGFRYTAISSAYSGSEPLQIHLHLWIAILGRIFSILDYHRGIPTLKLNVAPMFQNKQQLLEKKQQEDEGQKMHQQTMADRSLSN